MKDIFRKAKGDPRFSGYTENEVWWKAGEVNRDHGLHTDPHPKWGPALVLPDERGGWMVVIESI